MRCLQQIAHIKWKDKIPNTEVLQRCQITGTEALLLTAQLRWTRHVVRMDNGRLPRWSSTASCSKAALTRRTAKTVPYKDALKANLTTFDINSAHLESLTADRTSWCALCRQLIGIFEDSRIGHAENRRRLRNTGNTSTSTSSTFQCDVCGRTCSSRIGLCSHRRTHLRSEIRRVDGSVRHHNALRCSFSHEFWLFFKLISSSR